MNVTPVSGESYTYTAANNDQLVLRGHSGQMLDTLSAPAVSPDMPVEIGVYNNSSLLMAIQAGAGVMLDGAVRGNTLLGPHQFAKFLWIGNGWISIERPVYAKLSYGALANLYVSPNGSDANTGVLPSQPKQYLQSIWDLAAFNVMINSGSVYMNMADGYYDRGVVCNGFHIGYGFGEVRFKGNSGAPQNVLINSTINGCFLASNGASIYVDGCKMQSNGNLLETNWTALIFGSNLIFGSASNCHMTCLQGGYIEMNGNYSIDAGAACHIAIGDGQFHSNAPWTLINNTPHFSFAFANATQIGLLGFSGNFYGAATGQQYVASGKGQIWSANILPGNAGGYVAQDGRYYGP